MKGFLKYLSPFAPDNSGVVSALFEFGGLIAICDAGGCTGNVCGFDEPRWFTMKSAVFSTGMRDMDAILGRDNLLIDKIVSAGKIINPPFVVLVGTPVPAVIATDFKALRRMAGKRINVPVLTIESTGVNHYDRGTSQAYEMLFDTFAEEKLQIVPGRTGVIGATPLDFSSVKAGQHIANSLPGEVKVYGMGAGIDEVKAASSNEMNIAVSPGGVAAAKLLEKRFGTPWKMHCPWIPETVKEVVPELKGKRVLVVHQQFAAVALKEQLLNSGAAAVAACSWFAMESSLKGAEDFQLKEEDSLAAAAAGFDADVVIADSNLKKVLPGFQGRFIDWPHFAVSGRLLD